MQGDQLSQIKINNMMKVSKQVTGLMLNKNEMLIHNSDNKGVMGVLL